jgi:hypothetical protein
MTPWLCILRPNYPVQPLIEASTTSPDDVSHSLFFPLPNLFSIVDYSGAGGMADTRNPDAKEDEDPRKSISAAPSFEEYLKSRAAEGN